MDPGLKPNYIFVLILTGVHLALISLAGPDTARADLYIWTDENGILHVSNISPPPEGNIIRMDEKEVKIPRDRLFTVIRIFDGDTIRVRGAGLEFKVRLVGIDAPEMGRKGQPGQPFSQRAKQAISQLIYKKEVELKQYGEGGYNRILAEVFSDGQNVNLKMIRAGLAEVYQGKPAPGLNVAVYRKEQDIARKKNSGMWSLGDKYLSPRKWRKENPWK